MQRLKARGGHGLQGQKLQREMLCPPPERGRLLAITCIAAFRATGLGRTEAVPGGAAGLRWTWGAFPHVVHTHEKSCRTNDELSFRSALWTQLCGGSRRDRSQCERHGGSQGGGVGPAVEGIAGWRQAAEADLLLLQPSRQPREVIRNWLVGWEHLHQKMCWVRRLTLVSCAKSFPFHLFTHCVNTRVKKIISFMAADIWSWLGFISARY